MSDPLIQRLSALPMAAPTPARANRIRMRCRARLLKQAPPEPRVFAPRPRTAHIWQPVIAMLGAAYLTAVVVQALRVYGLP